MAKKKDAPTLERKVEEVLVKWDRLDGRDMIGHEEDYRRGTDQHGRTVEVNRGTGVVGTIHIDGELRCQVASRRVVEHTRQRLGSFVVLDA